MRAIRPWRCSDLYRIINGALRKSRLTTLVTSNTVWVMVHIPLNSHGGKGQKRSKWAEALDMELR